MSETPIYFVEWCQVDTPLTNLPAAADNERIWKFYKHGFEGISIECNGVRVAHLNFAKATKDECISSQWVSSKVKFISLDPDRDKTLAIRSDLYLVISNLLTVDDAGSSHGQIQ